MGAAAVRRHVLHGRNTAFIAVIFTDNNPFLSYLIQSHFSNNSLITLLSVFHSSICRYIFIKKTEMLHFSISVLYKSTRRDSNPRPSPWQGDTPPLSHSCIFYDCRTVPATIVIIHQNLFSVNRFFKNFRQNFCSFSAAVPGIHTVHQIHTGGRKIRLGRLTFSQPCR